MRVLALTKYDDLAASTRQRFMLYEPALSQAGIIVTYAPLLSNDHLVGLIRDSRFSPFDVMRAYFRRVADLLRARHYDVLWVHCELFPYFPGVLERMAGIWGKPIVYDYDDAIFHMYDESPNPLIRRLLGRKLVPLMRSAAACCGGNRYLRDYAAQFCPRTMILPTVVDTAHYRPVAPQDRAPVIGWIGSPTTWANVRPLLPLLAEICREHGVRVHAVGAGATAESDRFNGLDLIEWSEESEIASVQAMDIGIMPLDDLPFQRGKSGYKLIQYMACGLPVIASPVGVNVEIVGAAEGFLASSQVEWRAALTKLIEDAGLRKKMGIAGRARAEADYSLATHAPRLVDLMQTLV